MVALRHIKREKVSLPVHMPRSKTSLLKLPLSRTQFVREDVGLCPFHGSNLKEGNFIILLNTILKNHLLSENVQ